MINSLPGILSAFCLNERGVEEFVKAGPFELFFNIFRKQEFLPVLMSSDIPDLLGELVDELIRHHPFARDMFFDSLKKAISDISHLDASMEGDHQKIRSQFELIIDDPSKPTVWEAESDSKDNNNEKGKESKDNEEEEPELLSISMLYNMSLVSFFFYFFFFFFFF